MNHNWNEKCSLLYTIFEMFGRKGREDRGRLPYHQSLTASVGREMVIEVLWVYSLLDSTKFFAVQTSNSAQVFWDLKLAKCFPIAPSFHFPRELSLWVRLPVFFRRANAGNPGDQVLSKIFPGFEPSCYVLMETNNNHENWPISCQKRDFLILRVAEFWH